MTVVRGCFVFCPWSQVFLVVHATPLELHMEIEQDLIKLHEDKKTWVVARCVWRALLVGLAACSHPLRALFLCLSL